MENDQTKDTTATNGLAGACILFFLRSPVQGLVKTRLSKEIGTEQTVRLYKCFVLDSLSFLQRIEVNLYLCFYPADSQQQILQWLGPEHDLIPQEGKNLGQRMKNAFLHAFNDFDKVIAIGSDSPDLPQEYIRLSFSALDSHDTVLGPASDGGYYLIGFRKEAFLPEAFGNIEWGSGSVFDYTVQTLNRHKRSIYLLPKWHDVDTLADLHEMTERNKNSTFRLSRTYSYASRIKENMNYSKKKLRL